MLSRRGGLLPLGRGGPNGIAADSLSVYWTTNGSGTVMKVPLGGGTPATLAFGQNSPECIVVDSTSVYWTDPEGGTVMKAPT